MGQFRKIIPSLRIVYDLGDFQIFLHFLLFCLANWKKLVLVGRHFSVTALGNL